MNRQVSAVANRLSLRQPQRRSLEILNQVMEAVKPSKATDKAAALAAVQQALPEVTSGVNAHALYLPETTRR